MTGIPTDIVGCGAVMEGHGKRNGVFRKKWGKQSENTLKEAGKTKSLKTCQ